MSGDRVLIYGPPGAGKSTLARSLSYRHLEREQFADEHRFLSAVLDATDEQLAVVRCCFNPDEHARWMTSTRATRSVLVDPGDEVIVQRITRRRRPDWRTELDALRRWRAGWQTVEAQSATREW